MKRFFYLLCLSVLMVACSTDDLTERVENLENRISKIEEVYNSNGFITDISPIMEGDKQTGYVITFSNGEKIEIYNGKDGIDGEDGEDGQDGNDGQDGEDGQSGSNGDSLFDSVIIGETEVTFNMKDGTSFVIPIMPGIDIILTIEGDEVALSGGTSLNISYSLVNASNGAEVSVSTEGGIMAEVVPFIVMSGYITVSSPEGGSDGCINVTVKDGKGNSFVKVIYVVNSRLEFASGLENEISPEGGNVEIPFRTNADYTVTVAEGSDWLKSAAVSRGGMRDGGALHILYLSNFIESKGYREMLELARMAAERGDGDKFVFHFAGKFFEPAEETYFKEHTEGLRNVVFHGVVGGQDKVDLLNQCHIFSLLSRYPNEGQPISILEAMGNGMAVITTDHAGIPEIASHDNGFACSKQSIDVDEIYGYLLDCYEHREKLADVCMLNYQEVKAKYTERQYIDNMDKIFELLG